jgi:hypothetical protein
MSTKQNRRLRFGVLIFFFTFITAPSLLFSIPKEMSVIVKEAQVRSTPSFLGKILVVLPYGERLETVKEQNDWIEVIFAGGTGWIHSSALSRKEVVLTAGEGTGKSGASSDEIALAGKGFNKQVEAQYKEEQHLDYTWVDRMEEYTIFPEEAADFLVQGELELDMGAGE